MMKKKLTILKYGIYICLFLWLNSCQVKENSNNKTQRTDFVIDDAYILNKAENDSLSSFLDSLSTNSNTHIFFYSMLNEKILMNTDSLAENEFKQMRMLDDEALIFFSVNTKQFKILVGKKVHESITNEQLSEISSNMVPYFKAGNFYDGIKFGIKEIHSIINKE